MIATMSLNGKPRKQLSDQLDRMDEILDVLGEGLTGAVVDAMKVGTAIAVQQALVEILTNPDLLATIRGVLPHPAAMANVPSELPASVARPSLWSRLKARAASAQSTMMGALARVKARVTTAAKATRSGMIHAAASVLGRVVMVKQQVAAAVGIARVVRHTKRVLLLAVGIGTATGMMSLLAPHAFAALASGATAAITLVGVQLGLQGRWIVRRVLPALTR